MRRRVRIIHLVCPTEMHVKNLGGGRYSTGIWIVAKRVADEAEIIALHRSRADSSYRQGRKLSWSDERRPGTSAHEEGRRFEFVEEAGSLAWPERSGAGEKAYTYQ